MKKTALALISVAILFVFQTAFSQERSSGAQNQQSRFPGIVKGKVIDSETHKPVPRATVVIYAKELQKQAAGGYTDKAGNFNIKITPGNYYIKISFMGYEFKEIQDIAITQNKLTYDAGDILLKMSTVMKDGIEVVAEKETMEVGLDRKVFNIEQDVKSLGGSAIDVLANIPSVAVDQDNNVSLRGNSNVKIMIDGRMSNLSSSDALEQIPATMISSIELVTTPGAKYDADGTAGIINIVTSQQRENGLNAMVNLNAGVNNALNPRFNGSVNANMNVGQWNFFVNFSGRYGNRSSEEINDRTIWNKLGVANYSNETTDKQGGGRFMGTKIGADYFITKNDVLTYSLRLNQMRRKSNNETDFSMFNEDNNKIHSYTREINNDPPFALNTENTLTYKHNFGQKGHDMYVDLLYSTFSRDATTDYKQQTYVAPDFVNSLLSLQKNRNDMNSKNIVAQLDYALPISQKLKLEAGGKFSSRSNDINTEFTELKNDIWEKNIFKSDNFGYSEDIIAAYVTASSKIGDIKYQLGVRSETTNIKFDSYRVPDSSFKDAYTMFFPSVYLTYELNKNHQFNVNFSSRIKRPFHMDLNPVTNHEDPMNLRKGNPALKPENHYLGEIGYMLNYEKTTMTTTLFYGYSVDGFEMYKFILNGDTTMQMPINISKSTRLGVEWILMQKVFDWWKLDANYSVYYAVVDASNIGINSKNAYNWNARLNSTMNIDKLFDIVVTANYRSKMLRVQGEADPSWNLDLALKYNLTSNMYINLRVQDIFNTDQRKWYESIPNVLYSEVNEKRNSRSISLGFTYKFNDYKFKRDRQIDDGRMNEGEE